MFELIHCCHDLKRLSCNLSYVLRYARCDFQHWCASPHWTCLRPYLFIHVCYNFLLHMLNSHGIYKVWNLVHWHSINHHCLGDLPNKQINSYKCKQDQQGDTPRTLYCIFFYYTEIQNHNIWIPFNHILIILTNTIINLIQ